MERIDPSLTIMEVGTKSKRDNEKYRWWLKPRITTLNHLLLLFKMRKVREEKPFGLISDYLSISSRRRDVVTLNEELVSSCHIDDSLIS